MNIRKWTGRDYMNSCIVSVNLSMPLMDRQCVPCVCAIPALSKLCGQAMSSAPPSRRYTAQFEGIPPEESVTWGVLQYDLIASPPALSLRHVQWHWPYSSWGAIGPLPWRLHMALRVQWWSWIFLSWYSVDFPIIPESSPRGVCWGTISLMVFVQDKNSPSRLFRVMMKMRLLRYSQQCQWLPATW